MNPGILKRTVQLALVASITVIAAACPEPPPATTTTTSSSTSSSVPGGPCDGYTPTGVALSTSSTTSGSTIQVTGNGAPGSTVVISVLDDTNTATGVGGSGAVEPGGTFEINVTLTGLAAGDYTVVATVNDDCTATAALTITS